MSSHSPSHTIAIIGGGIVGSALLYTLAHRGVDAILFEAEPELGLGASGTNSGVLHTGFDSAPGQLETDLILRAARIRPAVLHALDVPVIHAGAELVPHTKEDNDTIRHLAANAAANGVEVAIRESDGALLVAGESVSDPVAFTLALAESAQAAGAAVEVNALVTGITSHTDGLTLQLADGRTFAVSAAINAAGLYADEIARLVGDDSFEIYPRKGEFFVFELPDRQTLDRIILPVPTKRTKGVLVFPTLDGKVVAGPTAVDLEDKKDWGVRPEAQDEILSKAVQQFPTLEGLTPIASYAGLRPAGRGSNYIIERSAANDRLIHVAAIRSTGLTASLGIADYVAAELLPDLGIAVDPLRPTTKVSMAPSNGPWWQRTARHHAADNS
ncbi:L-2-hydroxyglutarate oxidase LhgO [Microbacterium azadirachtae]|uniref:L-2-hydroxyglutarate oxidase LhgO n=1 Tax=Microbacterium azadirachtae TaxID=582680 RepID=A0A0F0KUX6_9MICO|nr:FAD-dependent oxidoreductase [Microbacterium azadirachtae]KJL24274.1 L-2-hydroxyglutarate oxidase LhgO [Microbacterium azadirachtae]